MVGIGSLLPFRNREDDLILPAHSYDREVDEFG